MSLKPPQEINVIIGQNLRTLRTLKGLSQTNIGDAMTPTMTFQQIQKYEKGVNRISIPVLLAMAETLKCELAHLVAGVYTGREMAHLVSEEYDLGVVRDYHSIKDKNVQKNIKGLIKSVAAL